MEEVGSELIWAAPGTVGAGEVKRIVATQRKVQK